MVEVLTPEQFIETLMPWDGETLYVCVRDKRGHVVSITDICEYLKKNPKFLRPEQCKNITYEL